MIYILSNCNLFAVEQQSQRSEMHNYTDITSTNYGNPT